MSEKQLIRYMALADDYGEIARIFFVIDETGEEIEGYPQIQNWVNSLYKENKELKEENEQLKKENQELQMSLRVDTNEIELLVCENEKLKKENKMLKLKIVVLKQVKAIKELPKSIDVVIRNE